MKQMTHQTWLPLAEYSNKYRVSLSTLRRRIKAEDIQYKFADGRYFIIDEPNSSTSNRPSQGNSSFAEHRPSQENVRPQKSGTSFSSGPNLFQKENRMKEHDLDFIENKDIKEKDESILTAANRLLTELKRAYSQILHEKEEQILQLKEEASDLKTLVRVLESENLRIKEKRS